MKNLCIKKATIENLREVRMFTDFWLAGRGLARKAPGAVNDYFISPSQHRKYIENYSTYLLYFNKTIIGWAVIQHHNSLIHFLIDGYHRSKGFGKFFLQYLDPQNIHSKSNQSSGDPALFYEKYGYHKTDTVKSKSRFDIDKIRPNRKPIIDIYEKSIER